MIHYIHDYFLHNYHPITIDLVGIGGTGSLMIAKLARMNHALIELGSPGIHVNAWDFDVVEYNNVGRQNFTKSDVGQNKAQCMIDKINIAFGFSWEARTEKYNFKMESNIIVTCVDNVETRNQVNKSFKKTIDERLDYTTNFYWMDTGNGKDFGQVVLGSRKIPQPSSQYKTIDTLKTVYEIFGKLEDFNTEEVQGIQGCSYIDSLNKQDLFINDTISCYASNLLWKLLKNNYLTANGSIVNLAKSNSKGINLN